MQTAAGKFAEELIETARKITAPGKGILAADESGGTIGNRFEKIKLENNVDNRRAYRELLFTAAGLGEYISGVIFYDETLRQSTADGRTFVSVLQAQDIVVGIKVDKGTVVIPGTNAETATQGLDDLHTRCAQYYAMGARFAKWRAVYKIGAGCPSNLAMLENAHTLARYAAICQANGLVPIVEPEVLMDGEHTLAEAARATEAVNHVVFKALADHKILLEGILLKPNMCLKGFSNPTPVSAQEIALATVTVLRRCVPPAVPGINFLSGGQSEEEATQFLDLMNKLPAGSRPWNLSFSYGRALQHSCILAWEGKPENVAAAQAKLLERCKANGEAQRGVYGGGAGGAAAGASLHVAGYTY
eukprot:gnl/Hemi2/13673_TR4656_c0_g1_i1.p1 gnl/Hemi2/13673_TR4656_c0_g1~~gnl/Hemi2/13673_TR4656_c0_g1_i1.p1  ORF type:complete len:378 (+),score=167.55 gnl/Hemi2/13673_TR4656_c0_g1_i1:55-1134(+)